MCIPILRTSQIILSVAVGTLTALAVYHFRQAGYPVRGAIGFLLFTAIYGFLAICATFLLPFLIHVGKLKNRYALLGMDLLGMLLFFGGSCAGAEQLRWCPWSLHGVNDTQLTQIAPKERDMVILGCRLFRPAVVAAGVAWIAWSIALIYSARELNRVRTHSPTRWMKEHKGSHRHLKLAQTQTTPRPMPTPSPIDIPIPTAC